MKRRVSPSTVGTSREEELEKELSGIAGHILSQLNYDTVDALQASLSISKPDYS